jgi:adenylylsulfate kinase
MAKAVSYRILGSTSTAILVYLVSGKLTISLGAGVLDMVVKLGLYFLHERIWNHIPYGRPQPPEYEI